MAKAACMLQATRARARNLHHASLAEDHARELPSTLDRLRSAAGASAPPSLFFYLLGQGPFVAARRQGRGRPAGEWTSGSPSGSGRHAPDRRAMQDPIWLLGESSRRIPEDRDLGWP